MNYYLVLIVLFVSTPFALAISENSGDQNADFTFDVCKIYFISGICDGVSVVIDSSNRLFYDDTVSGLENSNTVKDVEKALLDEDLKQTQQRTYKAWNNILSVMYLVLEAVKILFYTMQIFILVHLPYFYVKVLVMIKEMTISIARKRGSK